MNSCETTRTTSTMDTLNPVLNVSIPSQTQSQPNISVEFDEQSSSDNAALIDKKVTEMPKANSNDSIFEKFKLWASAQKIKLFASAIFALAIACFAGAPFAPPLVAIGLVCLGLTSFTAFGIMVGYNGKDAFAYLEAESREKALDEKRKNKALEEIVALNTPKNQKANIKDLIDKFAEENANRTSLKNHKDFGKLSAPIQVPQFEPVLVDKNSKEIINDVKEDI